MSSISVSDNNFTTFSYVKIFTSSIFHFSVAKIKNLAYSIFKKNPPIFNSEYAWNQNLSLMKEAQEKTNDVKLKHRIRFLAVNYLNKIAPYMPSTARMSSWNFFESAFQVSPYSLYYYHRSFYYSQPDISSTINQNFALGDNSPLVLTDTDQFAHFLSLKFVVLSQENREQWPSLIIKAMEAKSEILFDFTLDFGNSILTEHDKSKEISFCSHFNQIKSSINELINSRNESKSLRTYLKQKSTAISRIKFDCNGYLIGGMKVLPLFSKLNNKNVRSTHPTLMNYFIEETGIVLGAVHLRRLVTDAFPLPNTVAIASKSFSEIHFETKEDVIRAINFKKLEERSNKEHVAVLGKSFLNMFRGLLFKITPAKWEEINEEEATRGILQNVVYRIIENLKCAEESIDDDNKFIQFLELAHAELATLLELTTPYKPEEFQSIYISRLKIIPKKLIPYVKGGLGKTAETVFVEVNCSVQTLNPNPVRTWCNWFYYEHANLLSSSYKLDSVLKNNNIDKIDLYGCTFNPSIESDHTNTNYTLTDIISNIESILKEKPNTQYLSIAIDCTNDYFNSRKSQELLERFEYEIYSGRLNFIFFGSGQKFDMLGMDHFYGSPFYVINNGADHWKPFERLFTEELHKTDLLSTQWFCLLYEFASEEVDEFKNLYFKNNRYVLNNVPVGLLPGNNRAISVSKIDEKADPTFIDVKIKGIFNKIIAVLLVAYFQLHSIVSRVRSAIRSSYGFIHPNITLIFSPTSTTVRLHSGILHSDNQPIIKFLHSIA